MILLVILAAYVIGSLSPARIIAYFGQVNLEEKGTRNPGATNVYRLLGPGWGILTGFLDFGKGFLPVYVVRNWLGFGLPVLILVSLGTIAGHNWPFLYGFDGGRGLATSMGTLGAIKFWPGLLSFIIGGSIVWYLRGRVGFDLRIPHLVYPVFILVTLISNLNRGLIIYALLVLFLALFRGRQINVRKREKGV